MIRHILKFLLIAVICFRASSALHLHQKHAYNGVQRLLNISLIITTDVSNKLEAALNNPSVNSNSKNKLAFALENAVMCLSWTWDQYVLYLQELHSLLYSFIDNNETSSAENGIQNVINAVEKSLKLVNDGQYNLKQLVNTVPQIATYIHKGNDVTTYFPKKILSNYNYYLMKYVKSDRKTAEEISKAGTKLNRVIGRNVNMLKQHKVLNILKLLSNMLKSVQGYNDFEQNVGNGLMINGKPGAIANKSFYNQVMDSIVNLMNNMKMAKKLVISQMSTLEEAKIKDDINQPSPYPKYILYNFK